MNRKAIVLGIAALLAGAGATTSIAKEPTPGVWGTWCDWLDSLGFRRVKREPQASTRIYFYSADVTPTGFYPEPLMPVDYSYDHIVDQP